MCVYTLLFTTAGYDPGDSYEQIVTIVGPLDVIAPFFFIWFYFILLRVTISRF